MNVADLEGVPAEVVGVPEPAEATEAAPEAPVETHGERMRERRRLARERGEAAYRNGRELPGVRLHGACASIVDGYARRRLY